MPSKAAIIGRVAVKVLPDTDDFRAAAQRKLDNIERALKPIKVTIQPVIDQSKLIAEVKATQKAAQQALGDIKLNVDLNDTGSLQAALSRMKAELAKLNATTEIPVKLDRKSLETEIAKMERRIRDVASITLMVNKTDQASLKQTIARIDAELAKLKEVPVELKLDEASLLKVKAEMEARLAKIATLDLKVNMGALNSLRNAISKIDAELEKMAEVDLSVKMNAPALEREKAKLLAKVQALEHEAEIKLKAKIDLDNQQLQLMLNRIKGAVDGIKVAPKLDTVKVEQVKREIEQTFFKIEEMEAKLKVELDPVAKRKTQLEIDALQAQIKKLSADIAPKWDDPAARRVQAALEWLARERNVDFKPTIDGAAAAKVGTILQALSGGRVLEMKIRGFTEMISELDVAVPKLAATTMSILALSASGIASAGNLLALGQSIASIAMGAYALPGLIGGIAIGLLATAAAFKDFNKEVPEAKKYMSELQDIVSTNFWLGQQGYIQGFIKSTMPVLRSSLKETGHQLGEFFAFLAYGLTTKLTPALPGMFFNLNQSIDIATKSTGGLANIITILGQVGASYLPRLATFFTDIVNRFSNFLTTAAGDGSLVTWIDTAIQALKDLWGALGAIFDIFSGLSQAATASGGTILGTLKDALQGVAAVINSPEFQKGLTDLFSSAHEAFANFGELAAEPLKDAFLSIGQVLTAVLPVVGTALGTITAAIATAFSNPAVMDGITNLVTGIATGLTALAPAIGPIMQAFGMLATVIGQFAAVLGPIIAQSVAGILPVFQALLPPISQLIAVLGGGLLQVLAATEPVITAVAQAFGTFLSSGVIPAITTMVQQLVPVFEKLAPIIGDALITVLQALAPVILTVVQALAPLLPMLVDALAPIIPILAQTFAMLVGALAPIIPILVEALMPIIPILAAVLAQVAAQLGPLIVQLIEGLAPILPVVAECFVMLMGALLPLVPIFLKLLEAIIIPLLPVISDLAQRVLPVLVGAFTTLITAITPLLLMFAELLMELLPGLMPIIGILANIFASVLGGAVNVAVGIIAGLLRVITGIIDFIVGVFTGNWSRAWSGIKDIFGGIIDTIITIVTGLPKTLLNVGTDLITGLWSGISDSKDWLLNKVGKFFGDLLPGWVKDMLGIHSPSRVFAAIGAFLPMGLAEGMVSNAALASVKSAVQTMHDAVTNPLDTSLLQDSGVQLANGLLTGMESKYDAIKKSMSGLANDLGETDIATAGTSGLSNKIAGLANGSYDPEAGGDKVLIYNAAPGTSLGSEEDLFKAANRARMGW